MRLFEIEHNIPDIALNQIKNGNIIYRAMKNNGDIVTLKPLTDRRSANTNNYYTYLIDNSPKWSTYPKRSQSFIGTLNINYVSRYTTGSYEGKRTIYIALPIQNTKIGICPDYDFWVSFKQLTNLYSHITNLDGFNVFIQFLGEYFGIEVDETTYETFTASLDKINIAIKSKKMRFYNYGKFSKFIKKIQNSELTLTQVIQELMSPDLNNFELSTLSNFQSNKKSEVWWSCETVFIQYKKFEELYGIKVA